MNSKQPTQGLAAIVQRYDLNVDQAQDYGPFQWQKRMGVHLAFHRNPMNIAIHGIFSVLNAWALLLMLYPFSFFGLSVLGVPLNLAMLTLLAVLMLYCYLDVLNGVLTTWLFALTYPLCAPTMGLLADSATLMVISGALLTALALAVQVFIGHGIWEQGIDDAVDNFKELFESKNPVYFLLLPFYTYLDLLFMLGYKAKTANKVYDITARLREKVIIEHNLRV